jgi:cyclic beta-1,2-glucan synthetase
LRGPFFYLCDAADDKSWSLGFEPVQIAGRDYAVTQPKPNLIELSNEAHEIEARAEVSLADGAPFAIWRLRLRDLSGKARRLRLASYRELACHEPGSYVRDQDFNAMHVQTWFMQPLNAVFARNRLLHDRATHRMSREIFFHAAIVRNGEAQLTGYEDSRTRFIGAGDVRHPDGVASGAARSVTDEGSLYTFDPAASLTLDVTLAAYGTCEIVFLEGHAGTECEAAALIANYLGRPPLQADEVATLLAKRRRAEKHASNDQMAELWPFAFSGDGTSLSLTPKTPRPWAHVLANRLSQGVVVSNEGEIHSFTGNERQNALTPFSFESVAASIPGQLIYAVDLETNEADAAGYVPFRRSDARYEVTYEMGAARFRCHRATIDLELTIFVPPDVQADIRILTLRNPTDRPKRFRVVPYFDMVLDENQPQSRGKLHAECDAETGTLLFNNPANDFRKGWAFAATSLVNAASETIRARFVGGKGRDLVNPVMVERGQADSSCRDDGSRVAAFAGIVEVPAKGAVEIVAVLGQVATRADACRIAAELQDVARAKALLQETCDLWAQRFAKIQIETNQPEFDRLVNHWLPYQLLASRLWGRTGPNQRGGAFGYRDQLQDVLPLVFFDPEAVRRQIVLHAAQQFPEGDVFKWWHQAPNGETGIGQRTRASDPHLWLPYVVTRYLKATGDDSVLDETLPYLEGPKIPNGVVDLVFAARPSLEMGSVYDHCRRAIDHALGRFGSHGLPLIGTGDWNDSIDVAGLQDKGESVWLGFFLHDVLLGFSDFVRAREGEAAAHAFQARTAALQQALDAVWLGDRYPLAYDDSGAPFDVASAMTAAWPVLSGAADLERGRRALDEGMRHLEKDDRILLVTPAFDETSSPFPGRVTDYPPGVRENGGQYSHGVSWVVDAYMRLAAQAKANGEDLLAAKMAARAFQCWVKISPIGKTEGDKLATYGLAPHQQPADIYDGPGYEGRGGWSWYTGSAARMLSAAYAILGIEMKNGEITAPDDLFEPKGALQVKAIRIDGKMIKK